MIETFIATSEALSMTIGGLPAISTTTGKLLLTNSMIMEIPPIQGIASGLWQRYVV